MLKKILILFVLAGLLLSACGGTAPTAAPENPAEQEKPAAEQPAAEQPKPTEAPAAAAAPAEGETITVILPKHEADLVGFWPARIKEFEEQTGIKVTLINMSWDKVADKVLAEMAAGGEAYDVISSIMPGLPNSALPVGLNLWIATCLRISPKTWCLA